MPLTRVTPDSLIHLGVKADEILLTSAQPQMLSTCNLIHGQVRQINFQGPRVELRIDCGVEFQAHLPSASFESLNLKHHGDAWMIIRPQSCHLIRTTRLRATQRLFVFICNRNTSRSPMAAAICNAEIARRLKVPREALNSIRVRAVSAGLSAQPGAAMAIEAQQALERLKMPAPVHRSQNLTLELAARAEFIFCMTEPQRQTVMKMFPQSASKTFCLQPGMDLEDPHGQGTEGFVQLAQKVQHIINPLVDTLVAPVETSESA